MYNQRILFLTKKVPYPSMDGESLVIKQDIQMCQELGAEVYLLALNTDKHYVAQETIKQHLPKGVQFDCIDIQTGISWWRAFVNLFSPIPYNIVRFYEKQFLCLIETYIEKYKIDLIVFEGLHLAVYADKLSTANRIKFCMRSHNVESEIWQRRANQEKNYLKKNYLNYWSSKIKLFETQSYKAFQSFIAISQRDLDMHHRYGLKQNGYVVSYAISPTTIEPIHPREKSIFFLGSFDWAPNYHGVVWFLENVWKVFYKQYPQWKFFIAGRNLNQEDSNLKSDGVVVLGELKHATDILNKHEVMVVPLFSGSGIRIKIIEAMQYGNIVISTSIGAEGIYHTNTNGILIAEDATQFLNALKKIADDADLSHQLRTQNIEQVLLEFNYDTLKSTWKKVLED